MKNENRNTVMGTMPEGKLLAKTAVPMMVSMLVQALYNVVDSLFVARVSEEALNAVSLAFPLQTLMIGFGVGTAVGTNAMLSRHLGEKDLPAANRDANTGLLLSVLTYGVFALIGLFFSGPFFRILTDNTVISGYGKSYCTICLCFSIGFFLQNTFERMLTATGNSRLAMLCQLAGAVTNIILDPVFIFGLGPAPRLEVAGAAVATVLGQAVSGVLGLILVKKNIPEIRPSLKQMRWHAPTVRAIYRIGVPSMVMQCISSVMNFGMDMILISFAETATAVFGVYYKLQSFIFMPVFGLNNGMVPIVSYNYGARLPKRVWKTYRLTVITAVSIMSLGCLAFETIPGPLLSIFSAGEEMMRIGVPALRIIASHFPLAGFCIIAGSMFQAVGNPAHSIIQSLMRQLVVLLPAGWLFGKLWGLEAVWFSFPLAELMSLAVSAVFMVRTRRTVTEKIGE